MSSLIRQLNLYGFRKLSQQEHQVTYKHPYFVRNDQSSYHLIKRKRKSNLKNSSKSMISTEDNVVKLEENKNNLEKLDNILIKVQKDNERISN